MSNEYHYKGARIEKSSSTESDMALINKYTIEELSKDAVFTFRIVMCDNKIDRDFEAFDEPALKQMAGLFVGKTLIKDHNRKSDNQVGRIYTCNVEQPGGLSDTGEAYMQLVASCYVLVNDTNASLIADIKGGIKKEVSVGFRFGSAVCSICGTDNTKAWCEHWNGKEYDGQQCYFTLSDIKDAYELSFVAVPAQRDAGTMKSYAGKDKTEFVDHPVPEQEKGYVKPDDSGGGEDDAEEIEIKARMRLMGAFLFEEENQL